MKKLFLAACVLSSSAAFGQWERQSEVRYEASNRASVARMLTSSETRVHFQHYINKEVARSIAGMRKRIILDLGLTLMEYKWAGINTCEPTDPRQFVSSESGSIHYSDGTGLAWATGIEVPGEDWDPCGDSEYTPKVTRTERAL